jgi:hypothetical protein
MDQISFTDSSGVTWAVREDGADDARSLSGDAPPGTTWLRFDSELEVRRLWHYPDDWRRLNPVQLETLLERASTVIARFRSAPRRAPPADRRPAGPRPADNGPGPVRSDSPSATRTRRENDDM